MLKSQNHNGSNNFLKGIFVAVIFFYVLLLNNSYLLAQKKMRVGFQASPIVPFVHSVVAAYSPSKDYFSLKPGIDFAAGLFVNYFPHKNIGFQSGFNLARKMYSILQTQFAEDSISGRVKLIPINNTVEIPLLIIAKTNSWGKGFFINGIAGISFDWNKFTDYVIATSAMNTEIDMNKTEEPKSIGTTIFGTSIITGIGLETPSNVEIGLSYHHGLNTMHTVDTKFELNKTIYQTLITPKQAYLGLDFLFYLEPKISYNKPLIYLLILQSWLMVPFVLN